MPSGGCQHIGNQPEIGTFHVLLSISLLSPSTGQVHNETNETLAAEAVARKHKDKHNFREFERKKRKQAAAAASAAGVGGPGPGPPPHPPPPHLLPQAATVAAWGGDEWWAGESAWWESDKWSEGNSVYRDCALCRTILVRREEE